MTSDAWVTTETAEVVEAFGWVDDLAAAAQRHHVAVALTFTPLEPEPEEGTP